MTEDDSPTARPGRSRFSSKDGRHLSAKRSTKSVSPRCKPGRHGEELAARYLEGKGCQILARNWRSPLSRNEIDLIVRDGECIAFVEVKTARTQQFGDPLGWITPRKQAAVVRAARAYVSQWDTQRAELRFDAVAVVPSKSPGQWDIRHIKNAFTCDVAEDD